MMDSKEKSTQKPANVEPMELLVAMTGKECHLLGSGLLGSG